MKSDTPRVSLAIAIPAYGRPDAIASSIIGMAHEAREASLLVSFYVSDDTPDDSVESALQPLLAAGLPVRYRHNAPPLGHDRNLVAALLWPDADYVWLLGSSYRAGFGKLMPILDFLGDQDLLFVNVHAPDQSEVRAARGAAAAALLREMLWHHTLTAATIYGKRVRDWVREQGDTLIVMPNFPQISMMLGFASAQEAVVGWMSGARLIETAVGATTSYWRNRALSVFGNDWSKVVDAFPAVIPPADATRVIRSHSARLDLFNTYYLTTLKADGQFRWASLREPGIRRAMHEPMWKLVTVLALPVPVIRGGGAVLTGLKRLLRRR